MLYKKLYKYKKNRFRLWFERVPNVGCSEVCKFFHTNLCDKGLCLAIMGLKTCLSPHYRYIPQYYALKTKNDWI